MTFPTYPPAQTEPPLDPRQSLPTMYDLPSEDPKEPGLPDTFHLERMKIWGGLIESQQQLIESQQREERLVARLRELGIDPEQLM
jgi:hypothetical protein